MADLPDMAGVGLVWPFEKQNYKLAPLDVDDLALFKTWVKNRYLKDVAEIANNLKEGKTEYLIEAYKKIPFGHELDVIVAKEMSTIEGLRKLFFFSIHKNHPEITEAIVEKMVTIANLPAMENLVDKVSGFGEPEGKKGTRKKDKNKEKEKKK